MENQHRQIKGYRELSQEEIDLMNRIKEKGKEIGQLCDELDKSFTVPTGQGDPIVTENDRRWLAIGREMKGLRVAVNETERLSLTSD